MGCSSLVVKIHGKKKKEKRTSANTGKREHTHSRDTWEVEFKELI